MPDEFSTWPCYSGGVLDFDWIAEVSGASRAWRIQRIQSLWSGYGELIRVGLEGASVATVVVKSVTPDARPAADVSHERKRRSYDVERTFYETFAARTDATCRVPALVASTKTIHPETWTFVLEDLDAAGFAERRRVVDEGAIRWLASFHARFLDTPAEGLWPEGTYWHLATRTGELAAIADARLREAAPALDAKLAACKHRTLVHGDAKLANFCFGPAGVAAVDFQYVGGGCGMRDVAYLVAGEPNESALLDAYCMHLSRHVDDAVVDEWRALYPFACADFYRFLAGWAPSHYRSDAHAARVVRDVLRLL